MKLRGRWDKELRFIASFIAHFPETPPSDYPTAKLTFPYHDLVTMAEGIVRKE